MRRRVVLVVAALALAALPGAGCRPQPQASASGGVTVELTTAPRTPAAMRPVTLRLRFSDARGSVAVSAVDVRARMPEMAHGAEAVTFRPAGPGRFEASHVFSMDGAWEFQVRAVTGENVISTRLVIRVGGE